MAETEGNRAAACHFGVNESNIRRWIANKLDGTEDDLIWCDKVGEGEDEADDDAEVR